MTVHETEGRPVKHEGDPDCSFVTFKCTNMNKKAGQIHSFNVGMRKTRMKPAVTQRVGDACLHTGHSHVADSVLVFGFYEHSKFNVPQGLNSDLQQEEGEGDAQRSERPDVRF